MEFRAKIKILMINKPQKNQKFKIINYYVEYLGQLQNQKRKIKNYLN